MIATQTQSHANLRKKAFSVAARGGKIKCAYCPEKDIAELQLDHTNGDARSSETGHAFWRAIVKDNFPAQILCKRHNNMKWNLSHPEFVREIRQLAKVFAKKELFV